MPDSSILMRLTTLQASYQALQSKLRITYSSISDLFRPVDLAFTLFQMGCSFLRNHATLVLSKQDSSESLVLLSAVPLNALAGPCLTHPNLAYGQTDRVFSALYQAVGRVRSKSLLLSSEYHKVMEGLENLFLNWSAQRAKEAQMSADASKLYKSKMDPSDADLEIDFVRIFGSDLGTADTAPSSTQLTDQYQDICGLFCSIFSDRSQPDSSDASLTRQELIRRRCIWDSLSQASVLDPSLDTTSAWFQLKLLRQTEASLTLVDPAGRNFYLDAQPAQVHKSVSSLQDLQTRLAALILEWPEQMVLRDCQHRIHQVLELSARRTSLARLLTALEHILPALEDLAACRIVGNFTRRLPKRARG